MTYQVQTFDMDGRQISTLGPFGNVPSARQAMLDHSNTIDLPADGPEYHIPSMRIVEGWLIGRTEYAIRQMDADRPICTCSHTPVNTTTIDPPDLFLDEWCPRHGRDPDEERERQRDDAAWDRDNG